MWPRSNLLANLTFREEDFTGLGSNRYTGFMQHPHRFAGSLKWHHGTSEEVYNAFHAKTRPHATSQGLAYLWV